MVCGNFISPLDFNCVFVNTLSGSLTIFVLLALLATLIVAARFRMSGFVLASMLLVLGMAIAVYTIDLFIISLILLAVALAFMLIRGNR